MFRIIALSLSFCFFNISTIFSQLDSGLHRCTSDEMHAEKMMDPAFAEQFISIQKLIRSRVDFTQRVSCGSPIIIPVAVHFRGNITTANTSCLVDKCQEQIEVLNEDFGGYNADITNYCDISEECPGDYPPDVVNQGACIQFCLAESNHPSCEPSGNLVDGYAITVGVYNNDNASCWSGYMNIFVDDNIGGFLGYAPLFGGANPNGNGITVLASAFGGSGSGCNSGSGIDTNNTYGLGRTGTHEAGHYFGLRHPFAGCGNGDGIADTPPQSQENFGCPDVNLNSCNSNANNSCGAPDFFFSFMDYVDDACMFMFTEDQAQLMFETANSGNYNGGTCSSSQNYDPIFPNGCNVVVDPLELALFDSEDLLCNGDFSGFIEVEAVGGVMPYTYFINGNNNGSNPFFNNLPGGTYLIQVVDSQGETAELTIDIIEPPVLFAFETIMEDAQCFGDENGYFEIEIEGGTPGNQGYDVSVNGTSFGPQNVFTDLAAGLYMVSITDDNNCEANVAVQIAEPTQLEMSMDTSIANLCWEDSLAVMDLNASGGVPGYIFAIVGDTISNDSGYFDNLQGDTLFVQLTDTLNCFIIDTLLIPGPDSMSLTADNIVSNDCFGDMNGSVSLSSLGGNGDNSYSIDGIGSNTDGLFSNLAGGIYFASVIDSNSCVAYDTFEILAPAEIEIEVLNIDPVTCGGNNDGEIEVAGNGGNGMLSYSIDGTNFQSSGIFSNIGGGTYMVTVRDDSDCSNTQEVEVVEDSPLALSIMNQVDAECIGDFSGSVTIAASGGAGNITYELDGTINNTGVFTNLTTGTYTVIVTDSNDCSKNIDVIIDGSSDLIASISDVQDILCFGSADGSATIDATGGDGNYSYSIDGVNFQSSNVFTGLVFNSYEVTIEDGAGCQFIEFFDISEPELLEINTQNSTDLDCFNSENGTISVEASGGTGTLTYSIGSMGLNNTDGEFSGLDAGDYMVVITDQNDCSTTTTISLTAPSEITHSVTEQIDSNCDGDAIGAFRITANGGSGNYTYQIGTTPMNNTGLFTDLEAGSYTVIITDDNNCTTEAFVDVSSGSDIIAAIDTQSNPACSGESNGSVSLGANGGTGNLSYNLDGEINNTGDFTGLDSGNYTVSITDEADCLVTLSFQLDDPDQLQSTVVSTEAASCDGGNNGTVQLSAIGGTGNYTYDVNGDVNTTGLFDDLGSGSYNAIITDDNDCQTMESFTIDGPAAINGFISDQSNPTCFGAEDGTVFIDADLDVDIYLDGVQQDADDLSALGAGEYMFELRTDDGCFEFVELSLSEPDQIEIITDFVVDVICFGEETGAISLSADGGTGTITYNIDGESNTSGQFNTLGSGDYTVNIEDQYGCTSSTEITIDSAPIITASIINQTDDTGDANGSIEVSAQGGNGDYRYALNFGAPSDNPLIENLPAGNYVLSVVDDQGCGIDLDFTIELMERPDTKAIFNIVCAPNPVATTTTIGFETNGDQEIEFSLYDARGQYIMSQKSLYESGENSTTFDLTNMSKGMYLLKIDGERITTVKKIIKLFN